MNFFTGQTQESQAEKLVKPLLTDEGCHVLSSFQLNQIASLTYGDLVCDEVFELIESIVSKPLEHTPLTLQKSLVVLKHILIYGSEKCVNSGYGIGTFVAPLQEFNTVLAMQQQQNARAFLQRLQGGGVDKGGPVREAATAINQLLSDINELRRIRNASASKESLVPVGSDKVAFVTDDVRHYLLKKTIEEQQRIEIKSNLVKAEGGFGGGYNAKDGRNVVGAAHGIEEMLKMATKETKKFSDSQTFTGPSSDEKILQELAAEAKAQEDAARAAAQNNVDLLGSASPAATMPGVDLLGFGAPPATSTSAICGTGDLLGGHDLLGTTGNTAPAASSDLLGLAVPSASTSIGAMNVPQDSLLDIISSNTTQGGLGTTGSSAPSNDLLGLAVGSASIPMAATGLADTNSTQDTLLNMTTSNIPQQGGLVPGAIQAVDPFASVASPQSGFVVPPSQSAAATDQDLSGIASNLSTMSVAEPAPVRKVSVMGSNVDRFSALDELATTSFSATKVTALDSRLAENRILAFDSSSNPPGASLGAMSMANPPMSASMPPSQHSEMPVAPMGMPLPPPDSRAGAGSVANSYGDVDDNDGDNPWVMGGSAGSGLNPLGPAPGAPPPPPPPA